MFAARQLLRTVYHAATATVPTGSDAEASGVERRASAVLLSRATMSTLAMCLAILVSLCLAILVSLCLAILCIPGYFAVMLGMPPYAKATLYTTRRVLRAVHHTATTATAKTVTAIVAVVAGACGQSVRLHACELVEPSL